MTNTRERKPILHWKGILAQSSRRVRTTLLVLFFAASVALIFTQLGFAGIGVDGNYDGYVIVLLQPIALAALLLGTLLGTLVGFVAGVLLYVHATIMPLNYYELSFVTPVSSILMLTLAGFILGVLLAFVLRNNPSQIKRVIYFFIVCFVVSWLYSLGFLINALVNLFSLLISAGYVKSTDVTLSTTAESLITDYLLRVGDLGLQMFVDGFLMAIVCIVGDIVARKVANHKGAYGLRTVFAAWLGAAVFFVFMLVSAVSFIAITETEKATAEKGMRDEANYLAQQIEESNKRSKALDNLLEETGVDITTIGDEGLDYLIGSISIDSLLEGYSTDTDGVVIILVGDYVYLSNDSYYVQDKPVNEIFSPEVYQAIQKSKKTDEMQRIIYQARIANAGEDELQTYPRLGYLYTTLVDKELSDLYAVMVMVPTEMVFAERETVMWATSFTSIALLLAVFFLVSRLLNGSVARRIDETNKVLSRVSAGDLDARVDIHDTVEFESLSSGINETVDALQGLIAEAESRMDAELATAKAIQASALPNTFPAYPNIPHFDIYALMDAAREVGGDFYDFFLIGDDADSDHGKLCFLMADVSGKGIPAALFMMKAKTQLRDYIASGMELGEAVENANRQLCDSNDANMFVTAWVGVLDYATLHVEFVNAGHNPPLLRQGGQWRWVDERSGMPLGLFDGLPYEAFALDCAVGDQLLLYTDGVSEAMDVDGNLFSEEKLMAVVEEAKEQRCRTLVGSVRDSVAQHAAGAEQSDDITILALDVGVPPELTLNLTVPARVDELQAVNDFIHTELDRRLCPVRVQHQIDIAVEELFVNVAHYAYPDATPENPGTVRVSCTYGVEPPCVTIQIADDGIAYDPTAKPDAVTPTNIEDVPIGGLGILMAKRSVDEMRYERVDNSNIVTIVKQW